MATNGSADAEYKMSINDLPLEVIGHICDKIPADGHKNQWNMLPYVNHGYREYLGSVEYALSRLHREYPPSKGIITEEHFYWFRTVAGIPDFGNFSIYRVAAQNLAATASDRSRELTFLILHAKTAPPDHPAGQKFYPPAWAVTMNDQYCTISEMPRVCGRHIWKTDPKNPLSETCLMNDREKSFRIYRLRAPIKFAPIDADYIEFKASGDEYFTNVTFELLSIPGVEVPKMPNNKTKITVPGSSISFHLNLCDEVLTLLKDNISDRLFKFLYEAAMKESNKNSKK